MHLNPFLPAHVSLIAYFSAQSVPNNEAFKTMSGKNFRKHCEKVRK